MAKAEQRKQGGGRGKLAALVGVAALSAVLMIGAMMNMTPSAQGSQVVLRGKAPGVLPSAERSASDPAAGSQQQGAGAEGSDGRQRTLGRLASGRIAGVADGPSIKGASSQQAGLDAHLAGKAAASLASGLASLGLVRKGAAAAGAGDKRVDDDFNDVEQLKDSFSAQQAQQALAGSSTSSSSSTSTSSVAAAAGAKANQLLLDLLGDEEEPGGAGGGQAGAAGKAMPGAAGEGLQARLAIRPPFVGASKAAKAAPLSTAGVPSDFDPEVWAGARTLLSGGLGLLDAWAPTGCAVRWLCALAVLGALAAQVRPGLLSSSVESANQRQGLHLHPPPALHSIQSHPHLQAARNSPYVFLTSCHHPPHPSPSFTLPLCPAAGVSGVQRRCAQPHQQHRQRGLHRGAAQAGTAALHGERCALQGAGLAWGAGARLAPAQAPYTKPGAVCLHRRCARPRQGLEPSSAPPPPSPRALAGFQEGRVYRRLPVLLRYKTCGGLVSQHYSHIAAVMIAAALGADIELQMGLALSGKTEIVNMQHVAKWEPVAFESLWNLNYITTWAAALMPPPPLLARLCLSHTNQIE
jgi:hypothetical protein